ncbi:MAG: hypothetical protein ACR2H3_05605 [Acidimicrobiales bacterium]
MDDELVTLCGDEDDELDEVGGTVGADHEPSIRVLAEVVNEY